MSRIIRERRRVEATSYYLMFEDEADPGHGSMFPCDAEGNVQEEDLQPAGANNLRDCLSSGVAGLVRKFDDSYWDPALLRCDCGEEVVLGSTWANECETCHREYNGGGQLLAPRSHWGEETGEHPADLQNFNPDGDPASCFEGEY